MNNTMYGLDEEKRINFGKHKGRLLKYIDIYYLYWLRDTFNENEEFLYEIKREIYKLEDPEKFEYWDKIKRKEKAEKERMEEIIKKLKPCPFCGSSNSYMRKYVPEEIDCFFTYKYIRCGECGSEGSSCITEEEAVKKWNTRNNEE